MTDDAGSAGGFRPWRVAWSEALYGERGFYRGDEGPRGHFETSANAPGGVGPLLAEALLTLARRHGCTRIVDVGAGRGELLGALAASVDGELALQGVDVVRRPARLPAEVEWLESPGGALLPDALAELDGALVVAHEWLDVVPCDVLEVDDAGELRVVEVGPGGTERLGPVAEAEQRDWCARWWPHEEASPGARVEVGLARDRAWAELLGRVRSGVVLAVDYGHDAGERPPLGTLAAHRAGRLVPPVPDGSCDLTADVAWDSLTAAGLAMMQHGAHAGEPRLVSQRVALAELGVDAARPPAPGEGDDPAAYLLALQRAAAAATLLDPGGLGGLAWLAQEVATGHAVTPPARVEP
jgi:SAM-dependent MidA family methyltransferase